MNNKYSRETPAKQNKFVFSYNQTFDPYFEIKMNKKENKLKHEGGQIL